MKVYVPLYSGLYEDADVGPIFSTNELAWSWIDKLHPMQGWNVLEEEVHESLP